MASIVGVRYRRTNSMTSFGEIGPGPLRRSESFSFIPRAPVVDRPSTYSRSRSYSVSDLSPDVRHEARCTYPTYLFRKNWEIVNDHLYRHSPYYGAPYSAPMQWTYYTPPNTFGAYGYPATSFTYAPRKCYNYDYGYTPEKSYGNTYSGGLYNPHWPGSNYYPGFDSYRSPNWYNGAGLDYYSRLGRREQSIYHDGLWSKPYHTWKTDHLSDVIERTPRSYDRQPFSALDSYKLSNDLYWDRRFKNYSWKQQYSWDRNRSLLPTKLSSFDQFHVYGQFRQRRDNFNYKIPGAAPTAYRSPSLSAVHGGYGDYIKKPKIQGERVKEFWYQILAFPWIFLLQ